MSSLLNESSFIKSEFEIAMNNLDLNFNKTQDQLRLELRELKEFEETVDSVKTIPVKKSIAIQQARQAKGFTRKQVAQRISIKETVLADYENGVAIYDPKVLTKLRRVLGCNKF